MFMARSNLESDSQIPNLVSFLIPIPLAQICFTGWIDSILFILTAQPPLSASEAGLEGGMVNATLR